MQLRGHIICDLQLANTDSKGRNCRMIPRISGEFVLRYKSRFSRDFCEKPLKFALVIAGAGGILCGLL
jgi:hypothetical protein